MKKTLIVLALIINSTFCLKSNEIKVKSTIKEVKVFLSQASIKHTTSNFNIPQGAHIIIVEDIAISVIPQTIQIKGKGNFIILTSRFHTNYIQSPQISDRVRLLEDTLEMLKSRKTQISIQKSIYESEEQLLLANKNIGGANVGVSVSELQKMADYFRNRLGEIRTKISELKEKENKMGQIISKVQSQLNEWNSKKNKPTGEVVIEVYANTPVSTKLDIEYICNSAYWTPEYEIRVNELKQPANLHLKGLITQNTGVDWKNVLLKVSTASPVLNNNKPILNPWWLTYQRKQKYRKKVYPAAGAPPPPVEESKEEITSSIAMKDAEQKQAETAADYVEYTEKLTSQEYEITIPATIESNNKSYRIDIQTTPVSPKYRYYTAPKISETAFLIAMLTDWEKLNLLSSSVYIFLENSFVGTSYLNTDEVKDTLEVSLGQDKNISIKRQLVKKTNEKITIGNNRKEIKEYEIKIKNKKKDNIEIVVEDQIPLSPISEIEVELLESNNAKYDKTTGKLTWILNIPPGEEKKVSFKYSVTYPKNKKIYNL